MKETESKVGINKTEYIKGFKVTTIVETPLTRHTVPGKTAVHEAKHVVAALNNGTSVERVTIVPGPGYLGLTRLSRPDAIAAAAPHATGESGGGHDMQIVRRMGVSEASASSVAKSVISRNMDQVDAVAVMLEEERTLGGSDIDRAIRALDKPKEETAIVYIEGQGRFKKVDNMQVLEGSIMIPGEWVTL